MPPKRVPDTHFDVTRLSTIATSNFSPESAVEHSRPEARLSYAELAVLSWRTLRRLGVPDPSLPDAVQDVLLVVHRRRADFEGQSSFRTWVFGIVLRVASTQRRSRARARAVFSDDEAVVETAVADQPSPFERLERAEASRMAHAMLSELEDEEREVLVLVDLEELTIDEAASSLGISESTCRSRLRRARRSFNAKVARQRAKPDWRKP